MDQYLCYDPSHGHQSGRGDWSLESIEEKLLSTFLQSSWARVRVNLIFWKDLVKVCKIT